MKIWAILALAYAAVIIVLTVIKPSGVWKMKKIQWFEKHTLYGDAIMIQYTNGEETILFDQDKGEATYQLDTEDAEVRDVPLGNSNGQFIIKGGRTMLFWYNEDTSFLIKAYVSEQEILKMDIPTENEVLNHWIEHSKENEVFLGN